MYFARGLLWQPFEKRYVARGSRNRPNASRTAPAIPSGAAGIEYRMAFAMPSASSDGLGEVDEYASEE